MGTRIINFGNIDGYDSALGEAARALREGALVVFPTETVYGVGANAADPQAVARLREAKGRADQQPFTVHLAGRQDARRYVNSPTPLVRRLIRKAWPGPLTLVCEVCEPERSEVAGECPAEQLGEIFRDGTVGLRCPDHAAAAALLGKAAVPVVASSANRSGGRPPFELGQALRDLEDSVAYAIDAGPTRLSRASTVVEVRGDEWSIRRAGALDERTIRRLARSEVLFVCTGNSCRSPMAEYLFRQMLADRKGCAVSDLAGQGYAVSSCGTLGLEGGAASAGSSEELSRRSIDASGHRSQPLSVELIQQAERIYVMTPEHRSAVLDLVPAAASKVEQLDADNPVPDPIGGGPQEYRRCAEQIERTVAARVEEFLNEDLNW